MTSEEKEREYQRKYREAHKAEIAECKRRWYQEHKAEISEKQSRYKQEHKAELAEKDRRYRQEHKDEISEKKRICYQENKAEINEKHRIYYREHKEAKRIYRQKNKVRLNENRRARREAKRAQKLAEMAKMGLTVDYRYTKDKHPFCSDPVSQIEGYEEMMNNPTVRYVIHHRRETHTAEGLPLGHSCHLSASMLKTQGLYYKRPASELIWMSISEHGRLHHTKNNL